MISGSLSKDDGDGNENGKKAIGFDKQNNNFARASRFFVRFFAALHDNDVKLPNFTFSGGREHKTSTLFSFSWTSTLSISYRIQLQKNSPTFDELNEVE